MTFSAYTTQFLAYLFFEEISLIIFSEAISGIILFTGLILLLIYNYILFKEIELSDLAIILVIIIYGTLLSLLFFIPGAITTKPQDPMETTWTITLAIIIIIISTGVCIIPTAVFSLKIFKKMTREDIKKRWKLFMLGEFGMFSSYFMFVLTSTAQFTNALIDIFYLVFFMYGVIIWGLLLYYGLGRELKE